jgi:hypothetical protein
MVPMQMGVIGDIQNGRVQLGSELDERAKRYRQHEEKAFHRV